MQRFIQERFDILIGLNDKDLMKQLMSTGAFVEIISNICEQNKIGFSVKKMQGGYIMQNGKYIKEESLHLIINGITQEQALHIADRIKQSFNQECVIVTKELVETFIV